MNALNEFGVSQELVEDLTYFDTVANFSEISAIIPSTRRRKPDVYTFEIWQTT